MVEVFKTDIQTDSQANFLLQQLLKEFPDLKINFDLEDCDNILRIETRGKAIDTALIVDLVKNYGFEIEILPDVVPRQTREGYAGASKFRTYLWIGIAVFLLNCCGTAKKTDCIDESKISEGPCTMEYNPVCGCDGQTYGNPCQAERSGLTSWKQGACETK